MLGFLRLLFQVAAIVDGPELPCILNLWCNVKETASWSTFLMQFIFHLRSLGPALSPGVFFRDGF